MTCHNDKDLFNFLSRFYDRYAGLVSLVRMTCVRASKVLVIITITSLLNLTGTGAIRCYTNLEEVFLFFLVSIRILNLLQNILPTLPFDHLSI